MKQQIYNLIILDESGSMDCVCKQTITGCNETLNTILSAQQQYAETQEHFVSIYVFQSDKRHPSRYLIKNLPIAEAKHITSKDYVPFGLTPLNDAVGSTLADLKAQVKHAPNAIGSVTIITDGMENASIEYSTAHVAHMIEQLKELGWNFNFIGANIDVKETAHRYCIDNTLEFQQDDAGTSEMFIRESSSRMRYYERIDHVQRTCNAKPMDEKTRQKMRREASKNYFEQDSDKRRNPSDNQ